MTAGWRGRRGQARIFVAVACIVASELGAAAVYQASPETYRALLPRLRAGDTLILAAGEYRDGLPAHRLSGAPDKPIVIAGPERGPPATFFARPGHNTVSIVDSHHLVIRNLVLEGNNIAADAVKAERQSRAAHHITLEKLTIRGHGNDQQTVGISTKCPAWNWVIREVTIVGAGTGMYLGDSDGGAPFVAGLIERNLIVDTIGYNLQIKHQAPRPDIPGMPEGRSITILRHNVFAKPNAGLPASARPNVLVGHFPLEGRGADDDYSIHGNFFYQNRNEALFQGEGNVALYGNLFVNDLRRRRSHPAAQRHPTSAHGRLQYGAGQRRGDRRGAEARRAPVPAGRVRERRVRRSPSGRRPGPAQSWRALGRSVRVPQTAIRASGRTGSAPKLGLGGNARRSSASGNAVAGPRPGFRWARACPECHRRLRRGRRGTGMAPGARAQARPGSRAPWFIMPDCGTHAHPGAPW